MPANTSAPVEEIGKQALAEVINRTLSGIDQATVFLSNQIPDVIHQLLLYKMVVSILFLVLPFVWFVLLVIWFRISYRYGWTDNDMWLAPTLVVGSSITIISLMTMLFNGFTWIQIWLAPKIYLLEYAAQLIK